MSLRLDAGSYLGRTRRLRRTRRFALVESEYRPHARLAEHAHERPYLCFVLAGEYEEEVCGRSFECRTGTVVLHALERSHGDRFGPRGGRCLNVELDSGWLREHAPQALLGHDVWWGSPIACWPLLRRVHARLHARDTNSHADEEALERDLARLLAALVPSSPAPAPPDWLALVERRLLASSCSPPSLAELAREAGVHPSHLTRVFRRRFGSARDSRAPPLRGAAMLGSSKTGGRALRSN